LSAEEAAARSARPTRAKSATGSPLRLLSPPVKVVSGEGTKITIHTAELGGGS